MFRHYIDPGTGSMLFTIIIGIVSTMIFLLRGVWIKLKHRVRGGKAAAVKDESDIEYLIFSDSKRYWNVFGPICEEFDRRGIDVVYWTMSSDDPALSCGMAHVKASFIGESNTAFARLNTMRAKVCLSTTPGLDVLQWKRSSGTDLYVHVFHDVTDGTGYRMFGIDCYDAVLLSGEIQREPILKLEELRHLPAKDLVLTGSTYMDAMLKRRKTTAKAEPAHERTILCAPSWGESSILSRYGEKILKALADTGYKIVVRPHPQSLTAEAELLKRLQTAFPESERFEWNFDNDNFDVLSRSDILISDFSGVIFDFAFIFDRPVICADTSLNTAPYDVAWLDRTPWVIEAARTFGKPLDENDLPHMKELIDSVLSDDRYAEARRKAAALAWAEPGGAAVKVVDYLTKKVHDPKRNG